MPASSSGLLVCVCLSVDGCLVFCPPRQRRSWADYSQMCLRHCEPNGWVFLATTATKHTHTQKNKSALQHKCDMCAAYSRWCANLWNILNTYVLRGGFSWIFWCICGVLMNWAWCSNKFLIIQHHPENQSRRKAVNADGRHHKEGRRQKRGDVVIFVFAYFSCIVQYVQNIYIRLWHRGVKLRINKYLHIPLSVTQLKFLACANVVQHWQWIQTAK